MMEHTASFPLNEREPGAEAPGSVGVDGGELYPIREGTEEDGGELDFLLPDELLALADDEDWDGAGDGIDDDGDDDDDDGDDDDDDSDDDDSDGEDEDDDLELDELLEMISRHESSQDVALRRVQSEIQRELDRRKYHYIAGEIDGDPVFFVPSLGFHAAHFDLSITMERAPQCCVQFKVVLPILCGAEMAPALLLRFAELNRCMRYFGWRYDSGYHEISLCQTVPFWDKALSGSVLSHLLDAALYLPLDAFAELEWLSTGIINAPVKEKKRAEMGVFLQRLEEGGPCLSPRALQRLRDGLDAAAPREEG